MTFNILRCYALLALCSGAVTVASLMLIFETKFLGIKAYLKKYEKLAFGFALGLGFLTYLISIIGYMGVEKFVKDFDVFLMWSKMLLDDGFKGFMTEYPPLGLYILAVMQWVLRLFGLGDHYLAALLTIKMPSILASLGTAYIAYVWAKKERMGIKSLFLFIIIAFNPAIILNASMWGQMDMLIVITAIISFYYLRDGKVIISAVFYTIGCLIKPQMIFFAPIFGMFVILPLLKKEDRKKGIIRTVIAVFASVGLFFVMALPFKEKVLDIWILDFFSHISREHPVNTASAFNLFGLHGGSFKPYTDSFLFMDYRAWGYIFIAIICVICAYLSFKNKKRKNVFLLSAFCIAAVFTLGVSMHERYILPTIAMALISYIFIKNKHILIISILYTYLAVINQSIILFDLFGGKEWTFRVFSGISIVLFIYFTVYVIVETVTNKNKTMRQVE